MFYNFHMPLAHAKKNAVRLLKSTAVTSAPFSRSSLQGCALFSTSVTVIRISFVGYPNLNRGCIESKAYANFIWRPFAVGGMNYSNIINVACVSFTMAATYTKSYE
jgi:hypothetical protein